MSSYGEQTTKSVFNFDDLAKNLIRIELKQMSDAAALELAAEFRKAAFSDQPWTFDQMTKKISAMDETLKSHSAKLQAKAEMK
jgi:hypothetical protein